MFGAFAVRYNDRRWRRAVCAMAAISLLWAGSVTAAPPAASQPSAPTLPTPSTDPFYSYADSLEGVDAGTVLRTRPVPYGYNNLTAPIRSTQVLYRTTDQRGLPTTTVATVLLPPAAGPTKLISYHMAYDALGSECDPSYTLTGTGGHSQTGTFEQAVITGYLAAGYTVVVPNYEGAGQQWTIGRQSGYAALDGIRAAEALLGLPASTPVGMAGYSGGSVPTQWGAEIAPTYAPELNIVGAAAGGLPVHLAHNLPYVSGSQSWAGVIPALIVAYQRAYGLDTAAFLSPTGVRITDEVAGLCINNFASKFPGLTDSEMVAPPYTSLLEVPSVVAAINDNIMGSTGTPRVPMLLAVGDVDGIGDGVMVTADVEGLARDYCDRGVPVTYAQFDRLSHAEAFIPFQGQTSAFFADRFAAAPPTGNCALVGPGNSLAPFPIP